MRNGDGDGISALGVRAKEVSYFYFTDNYLVLEDEVDGIGWSELLVSTKKIIRWP